MILLKVSILGLIFTIMSFCVAQTHTLNLLISLEGVMLSLLLFLYSVSVFDSSQPFLLLALLTFAACEAALGLSLLVSMLRLRGNDLVSSLSSLNFYAQTASN